MNIITIHEQTVVEFESMENGDEKWKKNQKAIQDGWRFKILILLISSFPLFFLF